MPQFDFFSFFVQIFWFTCGCISCYLIYKKLMAKNTSEVLKIRQKLVALIRKAFESKHSSFFIYNIIKFVSKN
jgi:hypothetical protein